MTDKPTTHCEPTVGAPAGIAFWAALITLAGVLYWLFGAVESVYCQCASSLCRGDEYCHNPGCGKLLRPLPKKGQ